jgi:hypothetical protein
LRVVPLLGLRGEGGGEENGEEHTENTIKLSHGAECDHDGVVDWFEKEIER